MRVAFGLAAGLVLLAGCGGEDAPPGVVCLEGLGSDGVAVVIADQGVDWMGVVSAKGVQTDAAAPGVYFVAVRFDVGGAQDPVGVWATDSMTSDVGAIESVGAVAREFSSWPVSPFAVSDEGPVAALECVDG